MSKKLLIIEDDYSLNQMLQMHFEERGFLVSSAQSCSEGWKLLRQSAQDLILLDQQLPDGNGIHLLEKIISEDSSQAVIMMTGQHDLELAIQAIKLGAADFVHKPIRTGELELVVDRALENLRLSREVEALRPETEAAVQQRDMIGKSNAMLQVSKEIARCAESGAPVHISGESGTGKEVVARLIHAHSGLTGPFVPVNCAAIVDTLLESELFGHEKGAFTGASSRKPGKFELAQDGTLFLDEIGEMAGPLQAKILRTLQEQVFERVGGTQLISTNARVISATNRDLFQQANSGHFREDLAYRLKVISIHMPPLRDRREDIPMLALALMKKVSDKIHKKPLTITDAALSKMENYHWPGNVRELENLLTQAMVHAPGSVLTPDLLVLQPGSVTNPDEVTEAISPDTLSDQAPLQTLDQVEAEYIQRVLNHTSGHKGRSCEILGISRPALDRKIKKYTLDLP